MSLKTESRTIDGIEITITQFPARQALRLSARVARALGPALVNGLGLGSSLALLFSGMEPTEVESLSVDLMAGATARHDGREVSMSNPAMIDLVFAGRLPTLLKAVMFSAEVNYGDFFDEARGGFTASAPKVSE